MASTGELPPVRTATVHSESPKPSPDSVSLPVGKIASLLIVASMTLVVFYLQPTSTKNSNTGSRFATVESLVDYGTFAIDKSRYKFTIDKVKIGKHFHSSKPPTLPTYAAGVYWTLQKATGMTFKKDERTVVPILSFFTGGLSHLVTCIYFYLLARRLFDRPIAILGSLAAICFGYLGAGFATTINNHSAGAALMMAAFYHAYRAHEPGRTKKRHWLLAGLAMGLLPAIDLPSVVFSGIIGLYLLLKDWRRTLLLVVPATLPGLAIHFGLTYLSTGGWMPVYMRAEVYKYAGSYWQRAGGIDALREPKHIYAFHALLGHHGLFSMTPLFLFSAIGIGKSLRRRSPYLAEALVVGVTVVTLVTLYVFKSHNYGGWSVGMRWFVPFMPLLMVFFGVWLDGARLRTWKWLLVLLAFAISSYHALDAISGPFQYSRWQNLIDGTPGAHRTDEIHQKAGTKRATKKRRRAPRKRPRAPKPRAKAVPKPRPSSVPAPSASQ